MFRKYFSFILGALLLLMVASPALAKSKESKDDKESKKEHKIFATHNWVEEKIEESLSSFQLFYQGLVARLDNLDEVLASLLDKNDQQDQYVLQLEEQVGGLETRIASLESLHPSTPGTATVVLADNVPQPFTSQLIDVSGYSNIAISASSSDYIEKYVIHYTDNPDNPLIEQTVVWCLGGTCPETTLPILSQYYRFSIDLAANGLVTATAELTN